MSNPIVHTYRSAERGLFVNSYLVEGPSGVVAVDAPLLVSDGRAFRARLDALTVPLAGVLITHPHPDHYNGVRQLVDGLGDVPVLALPEVDRTIREHDAAKRAQWGPVFGNEWPSTVTFPTDTVTDGDPVELAGLRFTALDLGPGESASETVWLLDAPEPGRQAAFVGDLVFGGTHCYLADGRTADWIAALDTAGRRLRPGARLYLGHGEPTGVGALREQRAYLMMVREVVGRLAAGADALTPAAAAELQTVMERYLPGAPLGWLLGAGCDAVAAELASRAA